jgi:23S rRNA pseudouridine955/2504/2580 synthase/23S rRNA pseudouridine1911/1915/1917 synthase
VSPRELHAVTRLDLPVSGVVIVARGTAAKAFADSWKRAGKIRRRYLALAAPRGDLGSGIWNGSIEERRGKSRVRRDATTRFLSVATARASTSMALLSLDPVTGRTHQLRIHAAQAGAPLLGDAAYGGPKRLVLADGRVMALARVALHASRIEIERETDAPWSILATHPADLVEAWTLAGGAAGSFDAARGAPWLDTPKPACE